MNETEIKAKTYMLSFLYICVFSFFTPVNHPDVDGLWILHRTTGSIIATISWIFII